jgi:hypothetical protein
VSAVTVTALSEPLSLRNVRQIIAEEERVHVLIGRPVLAGLRRDWFHGESAS